MKTHLNTLFVTTDGAYLAKSGLSLAVRVPAAPKDADAEDGRAGPRKLPSASPCTTSTASSPSAASGLRRPCWGPPRRPA